MPRIDETRVLFNWKPGLLNHRLGSRFRRRLIQAGWWPLSVQTRRPQVEAGRNADADLFEWHKDEGATLFAVWSNILPTEVKLADGTLLTAQAGDVILINNAEVEHRAPRDWQDRWFCRTGNLIRIDRG